MPAPSQGRRRGRRSPDDHTPLPLILPAPPAVPGGIRPEWSTPCSGPFDHPDYRFSVDWDGARCLLFASAEGVRLQSETLADAGERFPEIVAAGAVIASRSAVLDGIVTILDPSGCPDLPALTEREVLGGAGTQRLPAVFLVTDLLHLDGAPTMRLPFDRRLKLLKELVPADARIQVPDWVAGSGRALADAAAERGLSALLARRGRAPYHPGAGSPDRLRIPLAPRADVIVTSELAVRGESSRILRLAELCDGRPVECGDVRVEATPQLWRWAAPGGTLRDDLVATVRHDGRRQDGRLASCELIALRDDVDPRRCVRRASVDPPHGVAAHGFRPTVLDALPIQLPTP